VNTGNNLLSSGYPVAELINSTNFNWTSICYGTNNAAFADQLKVWNGSTYVNYYFFKKTTGTVVGWCKGSATTATTDTIPVGSAFWYLRKAVDSTTLTQNKPF
jgi:hypothetical protein